MRVTLGLSVLLFATLAWGQTLPSITEYSIPYPGSHPQGIVYGPDAAVWFTDLGTNSIGKLVQIGGITVITEFPTPTPNSGPTAIVAGLQDDIWFTETNANQIGRLTRNGTFTEYPIPTPSSAPTGITVGTDGALWFTERDGNKIGRITTAGVITEYAIPTASSQPVSLTTDGTPSELWFTEQHGNNIGQITYAGVITEYAIPTLQSNPTGIAALSREDPLVGRAMFTESATNSVGVITQIHNPKGANSPATIAEIPLPTAGGGASGIAPDYFGNADCFVESAASVINCLSLDVGLVGNHQFREYAIPQAATNPQGITSGADGYWFTEPASGKIGHVVVNLTGALSITTSALPPAALGSPYSFALSASGGTAPYTWSAIPNALPAGLSLSTAGVISGTATTLGTQNFDVTVTDAAGAVVAAYFTLQVNTAECTFTLSASGETFPAVGGVGSFSFTAPSGCPWTVISGTSWLTANRSGSGSGSVYYSVHANSSLFTDGTLSPRSTTLNVNGQSFTIHQQGGDGRFGLQYPMAYQGSGLSPEMPHLAAGAGWRTSFTLVNTGSASSELWTSFYGGDGNLLNLPLMFPQQPSQNTSGAKWVDQTLAPNQSLVFEASGPASSPFVEGLADVAGFSSPINGFAIFHYDPSGQEAVVPLGGSGFVIPFDNTSGVTTGIAIASSNLIAASYPIVLLDDTGAQIGDGTESITLPGYGHTSFVLPTQFPVTTNKRGTLILGTCFLGSVHYDLCTPLSTVGIRYTPPGTLTTIPSLGIPAKDVPPFGFYGLATEPSGGMMPHIASGNGWQTTFVLSNVPAIPPSVPGFGSSPQQATLSFFDDNGNPLTLPLTFPQTGANMTASSVTQTIPANGTLYIQTSGDIGTALLTGSAQLGGVNGFAIFRYNPNGQEAVVPIQGTPAPSTTASILAFDNTSNIATGVAISNGSAQAVTVPVAIRDDQGKQISTSTISLAANGHASFMLAQQYPATTKIRGTLEFGIPGAGTSSAATIGVLGIRSPPQLTFTTLPALPK